MSWIVYGLVHGLMRAALIETNIIQRLDGLRLSFWQVVFSALIFQSAWVAIGMPAPHDIGLSKLISAYFYLAAFIVGIIFVTGLLIQNKLSEQNQGRITGFSVPIEAVAATLIWLAAGGSLAASGLADPVSALLIALAFVLGISGLLRLRSHDVRSVTIMLVCVAIGLTYATSGIGAKIIINHAAPLEGAVSFLSGAHVAMVLVLGLACIVKGKADRAIFNRKLVLTGLISGILGAAAYMTFIMSVVMAPNPGYISLLAMLIPVWLMIFHKLTGRPEAANPLSALLLIAGVALLCAVFVVPHIVPHIEMELLQLR